MDLDKRFEKLLVKTENIALIEAYTALKKQTINAMNDAIKAIDVLERALEKAETSDSNCNIPHVVFSEAELKAKLDEQKEEHRQWLINEGYELLAERL